MLIKAQTLLLQLNPQHIESLHTNPQQIKSCTTDPQQKLTRQQVAYLLYEKSWIGCNKLNYWSLGCDHGQATITQQRLRP